jgi:hypothetical protein
MSFYSDASLALIPSGYKNGKVYSALPTDGSGDLSFTRASNATRVASNGLIEKVRTNLILQSNTFSTTWINTGSSDTGGQSGYDGTNNAWLLQSTIASGEAYLRQTISTSGLKTFSIYAKAGTANFLGVYVNATSGTDPFAYFNLSTGAVGTTSATATASIVSVGSGWYRCSVAYDATIANIDVYVTTADGSFLSTTGNNIVIQASQLEEGDIATDYIATTTTAVSVGPVSGLPRLDYYDSTCPRLLLEPQRTNLFTYSEQTDLMSKSFGGVGLVPVVTSNQGNSPSGYFDADRVIFSLNGGTTTADLSDLRRNIVTTAGTYTFSFWVKSFDGSSSYNMVVRDANGIANPMQVDGSWKRYTVTATTYPTGVSVMGLGIRGGQSPTNPNIADILIWGFQFEAGAYATSYIPTLSTSVTRVADAASKTGISSLIGQTEGTLYVDTNAIPAGVNQSALAITDGTTNNRIWLRFGSNNILNAVFITNNVVIGAINTSVIANNSRMKIAFGYKNSDFALYVNGVLVGSQSSGTLAPSAAFSTVGFNLFPTQQNHESPVSQALLFKTRLSNSDLAALTA